MAKLTLPYDIINDTPANATPLQSDLVRIEQHVNQEVIERGGTVAMTAQLKLVGNPIAALDAAPKQYVDQVLPIGVITMYGGAVAPVGGVWLLCDGAEYETAIYPDLAQVLGNAVSGRFVVPDLTQRVPLGTGGTYTRLSKGGSNDAILLAHDHDIAHTHPANTSGDDTPDHAHLVPNHTHPAGGLTASQGTHNHGPGVGTAYLTWQPGSGQVLGNGGAAMVEFGTPPATDQNINPPISIGGNTGGTGDFGSYGANVRHRHSTPALAHAGVSGQRGESGVGKNLPQYYVITFLIKAA